MINYKYPVNKYTISIVLALVACFLLLFNVLTASAKVSGQCSNCHTMHNSQNGSQEATLGAEGQPWKGQGPFPVLLRGDCLGCHGMGTAANIDPLTNAPQVFHTNSTDLAGGNFAYIIGIKGSGASDTKGHNVIDLGDQENTHDEIPGAFVGESHDDVISMSDFTCAGDSGCHGPRLAASGKSNLLALRGAHHNDETGQLTVADNDYNSFRFLWGVKGYEDDDWQATSSSTDHNEYYGVASPLELSAGSCNECHQPQSVQAIQGTISGFCGTCHGNFHSLSGDGIGPNDYGAGAGIGQNNSSPFQRHPTDILLPSSGEYTAYVNYNLNVPVGRTSVYSGSSTSVSSADVVICLSCHRAHASDYPDMLRWDYDGMIAGSPGSSGAGTGCFQCHSEKDDVM